VDSQPFPRWSVTRKQRPRNPGTLISRPCRCHTPRMLATPSAAVGSGAGKIHTTAYQTSPTLDVVKRLLSAEPGDFSQFLPPAKNLLTDTRIQVFTHGWFGLFTDD
jgi:hypothetical protein